MSVAHQTHQNSNRPFNSEVIQRSGGESTTVPPENEKFTKKQKRNIAIIAISSLLAGGVIADKIFGKAESVPVHPNAAITDTVNPAETQKTPAIPNEAKQFVSEVGSRYADPVSTYYAEIAYENTHNKQGLPISDVYVENYKFLDYAAEKESDLGFTSYELPASAKDNQETAMKIFDEYMVKNLNLYLNLLSKNPLPKAEAVIDNQFRNYCSDTGGTGLPIEFTADNDAINKLMATAKSVVSKYGSTANYSVANSSTNRKDVSATTFPDILGAIETINFNGQKLSSLQANGVNLTINIDKYDGKNVSRKREVLNGLQLSFIKQPITGTIDSTSSHYVSIGQR